MCLTDCPYDPVMCFLYFQEEIEYSPRGRLELAPIFELVKQFTTPPNRPVQKSYYGRRRLPKAQI